MVSVIQKSRFSSTYLLSVTWQNMPSLVFVNKALLERTIHLQTVWKNGNQGPRRTRPSAFDGYLHKNCLGCDSSVIFTSLYALAVEHFTEVKAQQVCVWVCFPPFFSIAMQHWFPVMQGCDQYRVSRAAQNVMRANVLHRLCNVVHRAGVSTVADAA